jgi:hypothetical protein
MAGPYPPEYGAGPVGPQMYPESFPQPPFPPQAGAQPYPENVPSPYPGMLPPPVQYPKRRRTKLIAGVALVLVIVAAVVTAIVFAARSDKSAGNATLSDASAKTAIQEYLDALSKGDDETVARHTLCGLFDAVKERRSDLALASIDKMVQWSPNQAQVLFTMRVVPASGSRGQSGDDEQQAVAQLLAQDKEVLVCSYLPRTAGQY